MKVNLLDEVEEILAQDCKQRVHYIYNGETCAIGALALAAGVGKQTLENAGTTAISARQSPYINIIVDAIRGRFGLTVEEMTVLQNANDSVYADIYGYDENAEIKALRRGTVLARLTQLREARGG